MMKTLLSLGSLLLPLGFAVATQAADPPHAHDHDHGPAPTKDAVAVLVAQKASGVSGTLWLKQEKNDVLITGEIKGLKPGLHGFHIHTNGDLRSEDGTSAGGHYAPDGHSHGGPDSAERHAGDLGNIKAGDDGVAKIDIKAKDFKLHYVVGRSLVVHADADDLKSQPAGNSGPRIAVGVIGVANAEWPPKK